MNQAIKIGRDPGNDIIINDPKVSRHHAVLNILSEATYELRDLGSTNGTFVNGKKISRCEIYRGDIIKVGSKNVNWESALQRINPAAGKENVIEKPLDQQIKSITLGAEKENDISLPGNYISAQHAKISLLKNGTYFLEDLSSRNGSYVNGVRVKSKNFRSTDVIRLANIPLPPNWFETFKSKSGKVLPHSRTFALPFAGGLSFVETDHIVYCEGASSQSRIHLKDGRKEIISRTLSKCAELLPTASFIRIHKSYLINLRYIRKYTSGKDGQVLLTNGVVLPVSRNYKKDFLRRFENR